MDEHQCRKGWVCSEHPNRPQGHIVAPLLVCEAVGEMCDDIDCKDSLYNAKGCIHVWIIGKASGPTSKGVCNVCDEVRVFVNSPDLEGNWRAVKESFKTS